MHRRRAAAALRPQAVLADSAAAARETPFSRIL